MNGESIVRSCYEGLEETVRLLQTDEVAARDFFNASVHPGYAGDMGDEASPLRPLFFLFQEIDQYLNNPGYRHLGQGSAEDVVQSFRSDSREALAEALERERSAHRG